MKEQEKKENLAQPKISSESGLKSQAPPPFSLSAGPIQRKTNENDGGGDPPPLQVPWNDTEMGNYQQTDSYGYGTKRAGNKKLSSVDYVVLHSTGTDSKVDKVNAHMEVDSDGTIYMASPLDEVAWHAGHKWQNDPNHEFGTYKNMNSRSVGIEFVNNYTTLKARASSRKDAEGLAKVRAEIETLNLAPQFKARLLNMTDAELYSEMSGTSYVIYEDISAEQKKSAYELQQNLLQENPDAEFIAHEKVSPKKTGEGESIQEFLETMEEYNATLKELQAIAPEFWATEDPKKGIMLDQAMRAMGTTQFYQEFYQINARAQRVLELARNAGGMTTPELIRHLEPDGEESTGMMAILGRMKNWGAEKHIKNRNFYIDVNVVNSEDQSGAEEVYAMVNGSHRTSQLELASGKSGTISVPVSALGDIIGTGKSGSASIKIMEYDTFIFDGLQPDDLWFEFNWSPMTKPQGLTKSATNHSVTIRF